MADPVNPTQDPTDNDGDGVIASTSMTVPANKQRSEVYTHFKLESQSDKRDELTIYLSEKPVTITCDLVKNGPLNWWKANEERLPNLAKMAKDYLAVSGTGVPCERLFSSGPDLISHRRKSMKAQTIRACLCLRAWIKAKIEKENKESQGHRIETTLTVPTEIILD